ncbi:hypothetical protein [Pontibacter fetidus]|uniref:Uncharacterized protein n=1 Tax=Pontibacter fetidus TaxID=2700082 RepID=A0A6B2H856_9BACT|nr:hypothetical protein [Pontibacter fetidus]NDK55364.1 hypothetical protein [Pontibacter fetidus]
MEELDRLKKGLENSQTMVLKNCENGLTCSFIKYGLVQDNFLVKDEELKNALSQTGVNGIVEGNNFERLRNNYGWLSVRVKTRKLLKELA